MNRLEELLLKWQHGQLFDDELRELNSLLLQYQTFQCFLTLDDHRAAEETKNRCTACIASLPLFWRR